MAAQATTGSKFSRDKTGLRKVSLVFIINGPAQDGGPEPWAELNQFKPTGLPAGLEYYDRDATKNEDGSWTLTIVYQGAANDDEFVEDVELDNSSAEDPIETFPEFEALFKKYKGIRDPETKKFEGWEPKLLNPATGKMGGNPIYGTSHYLTSNTVLRVTFNTRKLDMSLLRNMCKIEKPAHLPEKANDLKEAPAGMEWVKRSVKMSMKGNIWQYTVEWMLGTWVPDIYRVKKA